MQLFSVLLALELGVGLLAAHASSYSSGHRSFMRAGAQIAQVIDASLPPLTPSEPSPGGEPAPAPENAGGTEQAPAESPGDASEGGNPSDSGEPASTSEAPGAAEQAPAENSVTAPEGANPIDSGEPTPTPEGAGATEQTQIENPGAASESETENQSGPQGTNEIPEATNPGAQEGPSQNETQVQAPEEVLPQQLITAEDSASFNNPENINQEIVDQGKKEDEILSSTAEPVEQTELLLQFADEKVNDIGSTLETNDFSTSGYLVQRLNQELDAALGNIGSLSLEESGPLRQKLADFAEKSDVAFRAEQLTVPEKLEQDFEITRGKLLTIQEAR